MNEYKLRRNELAEERESLLHRQGHTCPLCLGPLSPKDANLDHDHVSGRVRCAIHAECNILLGKIENFLARYPRGLKDEDRMANFLANAGAYMGASYTDNPFHPAHLTADDKTAKHYRRMIKKSKKPETKLKWRTKLKELGYER